MYNFKNAFFPSLSAGLFLLAAQASNEPLPQDNLDQHLHHPDCLFCELQGSEVSKPSYIPRRDYSDFQKLHLRNASGTSLEKNSTAAVFNFTYDDEVTSESKTVIEYCADIWSDILTTDIPIEVYVTEREYDTEGTLASAGSNGFILTEGHSYLPDHYSQIVIGNRIYGMDVNADQFEIVVSINKDKDFYKGIDGNCPADKYDLASVLLHELGHGLGYQGSIDTEEGYDEDLTATYGHGEEAGSSYDYYLVDLEGDSILGTLAPLEESVELRAKVTTNNVYFSGPLTKQASSPTGAKIYAPEGYQIGSSISHLDEEFYPGGSVNAAMTPQVNKGEVHHDPGPIAIAMLGDMGWNHVWLNHTLVKDTKDVESNIQFSATLAADEPLQGNLNLYYRKKQAVETSEAIEGEASEVVSNPFQTVSFEQQQDNPEAFEITFPIPGEPVKYEYYVGVDASSSRTFTIPRQGAEAPHTLNIGPDDVGPVINHGLGSPIYSIATTVTLQANVVDNFEMGEVFFEVWVGENFVDTFAAENTEENTYTAIATLPVLTGAETVDYKILAFDGSEAQNQSTLPAEGFFNLPIENIYEPVSAYSNNIDDFGPEAFILDGFLVKQLPFFDSVSLGTPHPYSNNGDRIDYYATWKQTIAIQNGLKLTFDEIVLVEPGEEGTVFGEDEFWDYVAVEYSKDNGVTWAPVVDGWDSSTSTLWNTLFDDGILDGEQDSSAVGTKGLYRTRTLSFDDNEDLVDGDVVMLRFHLFSDPYTVGWGWEIDNIEVGL